MSKKKSNTYWDYLEKQNKKIKIALSLSAFGLLLFIALALTLPFGDNLMSRLFPKSPTRAQALPPNLVQYTVASSSGQVNSISASWSSNTTEGNLLIAAVSSNSQSSDAISVTSEPEGWVKAAENNNGNNLKQWVYYYANSPQQSGEVKFEFSGDTKSAITIAEYDNIETDNPLGVTSSSNGDSISPSNNITPTSDDQFIITAVTAGNSVTFSSPSDGSTLASQSSTSGDDSSTNTSISLLHSLSSNTNEVSTAVVIDPSASWIATSLTFQAKQVIQQFATTSSLVAGTLRKWYPVTIDFSGPSHSETDNSPNPFLDYRLQVTFTSPSGKTYNVPGYFDGDGNGGGTGDVWRVKFTPDEAGDWNYTASFRQGSNVAVNTSPTAGTSTSFDGETGSFTVVDRDPNAPGFFKWGRLEYVGGHYLKYRDGSYWIKGGADSPENLLGYAGFDNTPNYLHTYQPHVGDWQNGNPILNATGNDGGKGLIGAVNYLASQNVNSVYFLPMNIGGDGQDTAPFVNVTDWEGWTSNDVVHYDISKLRQWDEVFTYMQEKGIHLHFVLNEAEEQNKRALDDGTLGNQRKLYYRELIARFGHHNSLQWNISEEYDFMYPLSPQTVVQFANFIKQIDPYKHPVTVHQITTPDVSWQHFFSLGANNPFDLTSLQYSGGDAGRGGEVEKLRDRSDQSGKPITISMDELRSTYTDNMDAQRKDLLWPTYLSGGQIDWFMQDQDQALENFRDYEAIWRYTWYARKFMQENLPFWEMWPDDGLVSGASNQQVFVKSGEVYAVYLPNASTTGSLNLSGTSGQFQKRWYNPRTGAFEGSSQTINGGSFVSLGSPPSTPSQDWVILVSRNSGPTVTPAPTTAPTSTSTPTPTPTPTVVLTATPTPAGTNTVTVQVPGGTSDGYDVAGSNALNTGSTVFGGGKDESGQLITAGFRFANVAVPQGATIHSASIDWQQVWPGGDYLNNVKIRIYGEASNNSAVFSTNSLPRSRSRTTAFANYNSAPETMNANIWMSSTSLNKPPQITSVVQEIVNRTGWQSGNALSLLLVDNGSATGWWWDFASYEAGAANSAKLTISYSTGGSGVTNTPTPTQTPQTYALTGTVYTDSNGNGVRDTGEAGYNGATVTLNTGQSATSNSSGTYTFTSLLQGTYTVTLTLPSGYTSTTTNPVSVSLSSNTTQHFGIRQQSSSQGDGDVNNDGTVDAQDIRLVLQNYGNFQTGLLDQHADGKINGMDLAVVLSNFISNPPTPTSSQNSPTPTSPPTATTNEWTQHAHDAQRTGYTSQVVETPWKWKWAWNGPNASGAVSAGKSSLPKNVQPVTGGGRVYVAAGSRGVFGLNESNGSVAWNATNVGTVNSTVAYDGDTSSVFVVSTNGTLYKLNASNGSVSAQFPSGSTSSLALPPAVISDRVFFSMGSRVYAINKNNMSQIWSYNANSTVHTPPSYSLLRDRVVVGTADLYVHAINNSNGSQSWRVKPSVRTAGTPNEFSYGWPVIAEQHGYVLMKMRLDWDTLYGVWSPWPTSNTQIRSNLQSRPDQQALFVLNLDNGNVPFIANIGHGGYGNGGYQPMGPQPVVKKFPDNKEVVYTIIRGMDRFDGRWDSHFGEMVLDNTTVSGLEPGYVRWIKYSTTGDTTWPGPFLLTDEQPNVTMAGDYLFGAHWMAGLSLKINNRSATVGTFANPITTTHTPQIVGSTNASVGGCSTFSTSHYCNTLTKQDGDPRGFGPTAFYIYWNQGLVHDAYWEEYATWIVSKNTIYYRSLDGAIVALENGNPTAAAQQRQQVAGATTLSGGVIENHKAEDRPATGPKVIPYTQAANHIGQTKTVEGTINEILNNRLAIYLGFTKPHTGYTLVRIMKSNWSNFPTVPDKFYKVGQKIRVTGKIQWYQGDPVIYVTKPSQIQVVSGR